MTFNGAVSTRLPTTSPGRYAGYDNGWAISLLSPVIMDFDKSIVDFPNIKRFPGGASNDMIRIFKSGKPLAPHGHQESREDHRHGRLSGKSDCQARGLSFQRGGLLVTHGGNDDSRRHPAGSAFIADDAGRTKAGGQKAARPRAARAHALWRAPSGRADPIACCAPRTRPGSRIWCRCAMAACCNRRSPSIAGPPASWPPIWPRRRPPASSAGVRRCPSDEFRRLRHAGRRLIFDINDLDETLPAPWEWDVKRLAASFVLAARANGLRDATAATPRSPAPAAIAATCAILPAWT